MLIKRSLVALSLLIAVIGANAASSQNYPDRPIRIITGSIGGGNDISARFVAQGIAGPLGQQVIVENRAQIVTAQAVAKATPDGHTLLFAGDLVWLGLLLLDEKARAEQPDPIRDLAPISILASSPALVVVHPSLPVKSIKELIALAKARPGELNYGKSTPGGTPHLGGERLNSMAGIRLVPINYKGSGDIATAVMGNEVHVGVISVASASSGVKSGRLKALAVTSLKPSAMAPGVPTVAETGLPGYEVVNIDSMFAPAKTPAAVIKHLNQEIVRFLRTKDAQERYLVLGSEVVASAPAELLAKIKFNMTTVKAIDKLIKDAGA